MAFGQFRPDNTPIVEWLSEPGPDRRMRLQHDFFYDDPQAVVWEAPKDSIVDGASIPKVLWSVLGGPFEGDYRLASIVHDVACDQRTRPWQDVHRMFYDACRAGGVGPGKARLMYSAVYRFGPRWSLRTHKVAKAHVTGADLTAETFHATSLQEQQAFYDTMKARLEGADADISLADVEALAETYQAAPAPTSTPTL